MNKEDLSVPDPITAYCRFLTRRKDNWDRINANLDVCFWNLILATLLLVAVILKHFGVFAWLFR